MRLPTPRQAAAVLCIAACFAQASFAQTFGKNGPTAPLDVKALIADADHRAIFCGIDGGEGSLAFSTAVARAITTVIDRRMAMDPAGAIEVLKQALCAKPAPARS